MGQRKVNSRALRQLAEGLIRRIAPEAGLPEEEWGGLATSLVRQWITYDGSAALFLGGQQVDLAPGRTPPGKPRGVAGPAPHGWLRQLTRDWKVSPDDLPEVIGQLNRGQSAEVVNADGVPLRLWVNPKMPARCGASPAGQPRSAAVAAPGRQEGRADVRPPPGQRAGKYSNIEPGFAYGVGAGRGGLPQRVGSGLRASLLM
jgi:hypothetical protein